MKAIASALAALALAGCAVHAGLPPDAPQPESARSGAQPVGAYIKHVVVIVQENRSFENLFAGWPGADAPMYGIRHDGSRVPLHVMRFDQDRDMGHLWVQAIASWNHGKMNGFDLNRFGTFGTGPLVGDYPYAYMDRHTIAPYREMARQYVLADRFFPTEFGTSFTAHQDLIAGTAQIDATHSLVDTPTDLPWGCDAPPGTSTFLVDTKRKVTPNGPYPCFTQYRTLADTLDLHRVSWKYYTQSVNMFAGEVWDAFDAIKRVREGPDFENNVISPDTTVLTDPAAGALPSVAWVIPDANWSDHPLVDDGWGPSWVADVVNAIGESKYWKSTAIVVLWDDWGGWYDDAAPPQLDSVGLGIRVPCIIVSPYAKRGYVSHTRYEYGSILKFMEQAFGLAPLHSTDDRANSIVDSFDFTQKPRPFKRFHSILPPSFFINLRQPKKSKPLPDGD